MMFIFRARVVEDADVSLKAVTSAGDTFCQYGMGLKGPLMPD
jgi:hypothetical protein